ncbi:MAG: hypothetical protein AAGA27_08490 [Pseudomonadota bacterium]
MKAQKIAKSVDADIEMPEAIVEDKAYWENHVAKYRQSNMTRSAYGRTNNLSPSRWFYWSRKLLGVESKSKGFVPIKLQSGIGGQPPALITVESARGLRLMIHHPEVLKQFPKLMRAIF